MACMLLMQRATSDVLQVGLVRTCNLDLGTSLIATGAYNVATGLLFNIPMPVQPMKAIAAVAVAEPGLQIPEIMAAGIFVSITSLLLGATNLVAAIDRHVASSRHARCLNA